MSEFSYKVNHRLRKIYWFIFRPKTTGVKCIIQNQDKILMIKRTLPNSKWVFPGGAIKRGEIFEKAIRREISEDLGITLINLKNIGNFVIKVHHRSESIYCFSAETQEESKRDETKLSEIKWFEADKLPNPLTPISQKVFDLYKKSIIKI